MADYFVAYDPAQPAGSRLAPEVQAEIQLLAPSSTVANGSITTAKLADDSVTAAKIEDGAVGAAAIADGGVGATELGTGAVTTVKLADGAVTAAKAGTGVARARDSSANPIAMTFVTITAAAYAGITPDPNTVYLIS